MGGKDMLDLRSQRNLDELNNKYVTSIVNMVIDLCKPAKVTVLTDSEEDMKYVRELAIKNGEEQKLDISGHTIHFDGYNDQARDKTNTKYLLPQNVNFGLDINSMDRDEGLKEIMTLLDGSMRDKEMLVRFYCLGPVNSAFSIPALQITDSAYVLHSEDLLYRPGYEEFKRLNGSSNFFHFIHSAGRLENNVCRDVDKRRVYIDLEENRVFSVNTQYAGNTVGLKKLALRLGIQKALNENWLAEHMFVMGVRDDNGGNKLTYFTGAFPSACGKTSTAMLPGQRIVGDDIAYLRNINGEMRAVNVEIGIFGIIEDVNPSNDPVIYKALTTPREVIFSNVLVKDGKPYWLGMGQELPDSGINYSGEWFNGKTDENGKAILPAHKNARYTIRIDELDNADPNLDDPNGVPVAGIIYGGRDSDTTVPVAETLNWVHGVLIGACLESETTAATLGKVGERKHNPMANLDFLAIPIGKYIDSHLKAVTNIKKAPVIFSVNYFLRSKTTGKYLNGILDKKVWVQWANGRVNGKFEAIKTPIGYIPYYDDLKELFVKHLEKEYTRDDYVEQFSINVPKYLEKYYRMEAIFKALPNIPEKFMNELSDQIARLKAAREKYGDVISPFNL
jgi:phosphoenolpyruvate carboxykinase (GTP)